MGIEGDAVLLSGRIVTRKMVDDYITLNAIDTEEELLLSISLEDPYPPYIQIQWVPGLDSLRKEKEDRSQLFLANLARISQVKSVDQHERIASDL